jgi:hypothetical protein
LWFISGGTIGRGGAMRSPKTYGFGRMKLRDLAVFDRNADQLGAVPKPNVSIRQ